MSWLSGSRTSGHVRGCDPRAVIRRVNTGCSIESGQLESKSRLATNGDAQHSATVVVWLKAVVLNPGMKRRCGRGVDTTERKPTALIPDE